MEAHLLSINDFSKPLVFDKTNAEYVNIIYLLYTPKGRYQSHPDMGISLREKYRYNISESLLYDLKNDIKVQMENFLPYIKVIEVETILQDTTLGIIISTASGAYVLAYNTENDEIDAGAEYILK